jgi:hypothetical protein
MDIISFSEEIMDNTNSSDDSSYSDNDSNDEEMLERVQNTIHKASRRMSNLQLADFNRKLTQAKSDQRILLDQEKKKKRRGSIQYYSEIQTKLQNGMLHLSE